MVSLFHPMNPVREPPGKVVCVLICELKLRYVSPRSVPRISAERCNQRGNQGLPTADKGKFQAA